jgi:beta-phosphoglucomutase
MVQFAAIWDVDGTLVDTAASHFAAWQRLGDEVGKPYTREDFAHTFGWRNAEIIPLIFGKDLTPEQVQEYGERKETFYRADAAKGVELLPGVAAMLVNFKKYGWKQSTGSSAPHQNLDLILSVTGTLGFFEAVVGAEDTTKGKPDPQVFLVAAQKLGVDPANCVVLEDAPAGVEGAKRAGMKCIGVTFVGHHSAGTLTAAGADIVVPSLAELDFSKIKKLF